MQKSIINPFYDYQREADAAITAALRDHDRCLVKMFCGTGKSLVMRQCAAVIGCGLILYVFPSLGLIDQFYSEYLVCAKSRVKAGAVIRVSSDGGGSTTDAATIERFLRGKIGAKPSQKIVCVTYQSFAVLLGALSAADVYADICVFDEAHHVVGDAAQGLVFGDLAAEHIRKAVYFTATPVNRNDIVMYDRDTAAEKIGDCGVLAYEYTYLRGVEEGRLNSFEIRTDFHAADSNFSIYECIARASLASGNRRILTFHAAVNGDRDAAVNNFVNEEEFAAAYARVLAAEYPEIVAPRRIQFVALHALIRAAERTAILAAFDGASDDEVFVLASCRTIGEGIDTKRANMCVFVDPKQSYVDITQNIGRIVRFQADCETSTVVIPCWVDKEKYSDVHGDPEKRDAVIRSELQRQGNYNGILNVLSALRQEDPELYDQCLRYNDCFSAREIKSGLARQGYDVRMDIGDGDLDASVRYLVADGADNDAEFEDEFDDEMPDEDRLQLAADTHGVDIEVHGESLDEPVQIYCAADSGSEFEDSDAESDAEESMDYDDTLEDNMTDSSATSVAPDAAKVPVRMYRYVDDDDVVKYAPIVAKTGGNVRGTAAVGALLKPRKNRAVNMVMHADNDLQVLWGIVAAEVERTVGSCVIDCQVMRNIDEKWTEKLAELRQFIVTRNKLPSYHISATKNAVEKQLGLWVRTQKKNYTYQLDGMRGDNRRATWEQFTDEYAAYFKSADLKWWEWFEQATHFLKVKKCLPLTADPRQRSLRFWMMNQTRNIQKNQYSMKNDARRAAWETVLSEYILIFDPPNLWLENLNSADRFIDSTGNIPDIGTPLRNWIQSCTHHYKHEQFGMKIPERRHEWSVFARKHRALLDIWHLRYNDFVVFVTANNRFPSLSGNESETMLRNWFYWQDKCYRNRSYNMADETKRELWDELMITFGHFQKTDVDNWHEMFDVVASIVRKSRHIPQQKGTEMATAIWFGTQNKNYVLQKGMMKAPSYRQLWLTFWLENNIINSRNYHLVNNDIIHVPKDVAWRNKLEELQKYISKHSRVPRDDGVDSILYRWMHNNQAECNDRRGGMACDTRRNMWSSFIAAHKQFFKTDVEVWTEMLEKLCNYIIQYNQLPNKPSKIPDPDNLQRWTATQIRNYKHRPNGFPDNRHQLWSDFIKLHSQHFPLCQESWDDTFKLVQSFVATNQRVPMCNTKCSSEKPLGLWINTQIKHAAANTLPAVQLAQWNTFTTANADKWAYLDLNWADKCELLKKYLDDYGRLPPSKMSKKNGVNEIQLGAWASAQKTLFKNNTVTDPERIAAWNALLLMYSDAFKSTKERWADTFQSIQSFIDTHNRLPSQCATIDAEAKLGGWLMDQKHMYLSSTHGMNANYAERRATWEKFLRQHPWLKSSDEKWTNTYQSLIDFITTHTRLPLQHAANNAVESSLCTWMYTQTAIYEKNADNVIDVSRRDMWTDFVAKYGHLRGKKKSRSAPIPAKKSTTFQPRKRKTIVADDVEESPLQKRARIKPAISVLHQRYKTLTSENLAKEFAADPSAWHTYHELAAANDSTFAAEDLPRNIIIAELENFSTNRAKSLVDLGCGHAHIAEHFRSDPRFTVRSFDHVSGGNVRVEVADIADLRKLLPDSSVEIAVLCLAMWGSNCGDYIRESWRVLETGCRLYICEPTRRWTDDDVSASASATAAAVEEPEPAGRLRRDLEAAGFTIHRKVVGKFALFVCIK